MGMDRVWGACVGCMGGVHVWGACVGCMWRPAPPWLGGCGAAVALGSSMETPVGTCNGPRLMMQDLALRMRSHRHKGHHQAVLTRLRCPDAARRHC